MTFMVDKIVRPDTDGEPPKEGKGFALPDWMKLAIAVAGTTVTMVMWANSTFISRVEFNNHMAEQTKDFARTVRTQEQYADAEKGTAKSLGTIESRLSSIETKLELLLDGAIVTQPRKKNDRP